MAVVVAVVVPVVLVVLWCWWCWWWCGRGVCGYHVSNPTCFITQRRYYWHRNSGRSQWVRPNDDEADVEEALLRRSSHAESLESLGIPWIHHGQRAGKKEHCAELGCCYFFRFTEESRGSSRVEPVHWRKVPRSAVAKVGKVAKARKAPRAAFPSQVPPI